MKQLIVVCETNYAPQLEIQRSYPTEIISGKDAKELQDNLRAYLFNCVKYNWKLVSIVAI